MGSPQCLPIANPIYCHGVNGTFPRFPELPTEIRLAIWKQSLSHHRLLEIELEPADQLGPYSSSNYLGHVISGSKYSTRVKGHHFYSKILLVNRESRRAALQFYRLHIPCEIPMPGKQEDRKITMYISPEWDFLHVRLRYTRTFAFIDFFHDLKAYDPQRVGLLNLALEDNDLYGLNKATEILQVPAKESFIQTLSQLKDIIWIVQSRAQRVIIDKSDDCSCFDIRFNHSMPIRGSAPSFDLFQSDPRAINGDLKFVMAEYSQPKAMPTKWQGILDRWNISPSTPAKQRFLFAHIIENHHEPIHNVASANDFLEKEEKEWLMMYESSKPMLQMSRNNGLPTREKEERAEVGRSVVGFWLFPAAAIGESKDHYYDMTQHPPELAVSHIFNESE